MGVRDTIAKAIMGIKAFHSSPHDFDKFDLKKIGTGEGAQVYGHGLYFAENPAVSGQGGQYWQQFLNHPAVPSHQQHAGSRLRAEGFDRDKAIAAAQRDVNDWREITNSPDFATYRDRDHALKMFQLRQDELAALTEGRAGPRTYEVNIKADPAQMLDWDKRLRPSQAEAINDTLELRMMQNHPDWRTYMQMQKDIPEASGKEAWQLLTSPEVARMKPPEASQFLQQHDIPGIKYLDEGSRSRQGDLERALMHLPTAEQRLAADPTNERLQAAFNAVKSQVENAPKMTSNYVVFDPDKIDILKKYGVAAAPTAALGATYDQSQYEVQP